MIFFRGRISQRVELSRRQLQAIGERVSLAQAKIEKIKGSKKAIKVAHVSISPWLVGSPRTLFAPSLCASEVAQGSASAAQPHFKLSSYPESPLPPPNPGLWSFPTP